MKPGSRAWTNYGGKTRQRLGIPVQTPATPPLPVSAKFHCQGGPRDRLCGECDECNAEALWQDEQMRMRRAGMWGW
jgi:hypothetical protein